MVWFALRFGIAPPSGPKAATGADGREPISAPTWLGRAASRRLRLAALAAVPLVLTATALLVWAEAELLIRNRQAEHESLSRVLVHENHRLVESIDLSLAAAAARIAALSSAERASDAPIKPILAEAKRMVRGTRGFFFVDAEGWYHAETADLATPRVNLADRPYVRAHLNDGERGLHIGAPIQIRIRDRFWAITFSRAVIASDGAVLGVVAGAIEPGVLSDFYSSLELAPDVAIGLLRQDGVVMTRHPLGDAEKMLGRKIELHPANRAVVDGKSGHAGIRTIGSFRDSRIIVDFRRVPDYPLAVAISMPVAAILWDVRYLLAGTAAAGIAIALLGFFGLWSQAGRSESRAGAIEALEASERYHRAVLDAVPAFVFVSDLATGATIYSNRASRDFAGDRDRPMPADFVASKEERVDLQRILERDGVLPERLITIDAADGTHRIAAASATTVEVGGRRVVVGAAIDVSDRIAAERSAAIADRFSRTILESVIDGVVAIDGDGRILQMNSSALRLFGYAAADVVGGDVAMLLPEAGAAGRVRDLRDLLDTASADTAGVGREVEGRRSDGTVFIMEIGVSAIPREELPGGRMFIATVRDITARKRVDAELRATKEAAEAANRSKSTFLANMSHELRTPLNAIIGFAEMISGRVLGPIGNPRYAEYGADILRSAQHLQSLVSDLLDLSQIEAGYRRMVETEVHLVDILRGAMHMLKLALDAKSIGIVVICNDPAATRLRCDERGLRQVAINLLSNAIKFAPPSSMIQASIERTAGGGLRLVVTDEGPGLAGDDPERLLRPFERGVAAVGRAVGGTGLGLAISREIVAAHGGTLRLENVPGGGARVIVELPRERLVEAPGSGRLAVSGGGAASARDA